MYFLWKLVQQRRAIVASLCMQFWKWGRGLLWEAFRGKGEWPVGCSVRGSFLCLFNVLQVLQCSPKFFRTDPSSFPPRAFNQKTFLPFHGKLTFKTACQMTSQKSAIAGPVFAKKHMDSPETLFSRHRNVVYRGLSVSEWEKLNIWWWHPAVVAEWDYEQGTFK